MNLQNVKTAMEPERGYIGWVESLLDREKLYRTLYWLCKSLSGSSIPATAYFVKTEEQHFCGSAYFSIIKIKTPVTFEKRPGFALYCGFLIIFRHKKVSASEVVLDLNDNIYLK